MKTPLLIIMVLAVFAVACAQAPTPDPVDNNDSIVIDTSHHDNLTWLREHATTFVRESPTYQFDGSNLTLVEEQILESDPIQYVFTFTFLSASAGYGDRSDQIVAQVLTDHVAHVIIVEGQIVSAILDGQWDMLTQRMLEHDEVVCTQDAMECPDGSFVGRDPANNCEFFACPTA